MNIIQKIGQANYEALVIERKELLFYMQKLLKEDERWIETFKWQRLDLGLKVYDLKLGIVKALFRLKV